MVSQRLACALAIVLVAMAVISVTDARSLKQQAPPPVTAQQFKQALSDINVWAKVPDISGSVSSYPNFNQAVQDLQGPAAAIVQAANDFKAPQWTQRAQDESTGLWAYGYQRGTDALSQAGKNLYNAYAAFTAYLGYYQ